MIIKTGRPKPLGQFLYKKNYTEERDKIWEIMEGVKDRTDLVVEEEFG